MGQQHVWAGPLFLTLSPQQPTEQSSNPNMKPWVPPSPLTSHPTTSLLNLQSYMDSLTYVSPGP